MTAGMLSLERARGRARVAVSSRLSAIGGNQRSGTGLMWNVGPGAWNVDRS